jgi:hypothetical protein
MFIFNKLFVDQIFPQDFVTDESFMEEELFWMDVKKWDFWVKTMIGYLFGDHFNESWL